MSRRNLLLCTLIVCFGSVTGCLGAGHFTRVDEFPEGVQKDYMTSAFLSSLELSNSVETAYDAPYEKVWAAAKRVAERLDKIGSRPIIGVDEKNGRIQNGNIGTASRLGVGTGAWRDQFLTEVTTISANQTKVTVQRKVVATILKRRASGSHREWRSQKSNGQIESWVLTQIENELQGEPSIVQTRVAPGLPEISTKTSQVPTYPQNKEATFDNPLSGWRREFRSQGLRR